jgi:hypothetical protein
MVPAMAALRESFKGVASFVTVYVAEAHARELNAVSHLSVCEPLLLEVHESCYKWEVMEAH